MKFEVVGTQWIDLSNPLAIFILLQDKHEKDRGGTAII